MNKATFTSFAILCLLSMLFIMGCKISVKAVPTTWTVDDDGPADFSSIQEAINSPDLKDGDTIFIKAGIYYEHVILNTSVSLVGEDRDLTIVDGGGTGSVISIMRTNNINISGLTIRNSGHDYYDSGIYVDHSSDNCIGHNTITNNYRGISFYSSGENVVSGNTITNNYDGISFYSSGENVVSGNTITNNIYRGMYLALYSINNTIYCNNFNNTYQVRSDPTSTNVWDDGDEGNYWSDYTGLDLNGDGIGDTAYVIDVDNQDNHPLKGMFSDFTIALKRETYHAATICNSTISDFRFEIGLETGNEIIRFDVTGKDSTVGFCRITIPTRLMDYPYIILVDMEEIVPTRLEYIPNETHIHLYFTYIHSSHTITIISSRARRLEIDLYNLNVTYHALLNNYSELQKSYRELNDSYQEHLNRYSILLGNYSQLQESYRETNDSYQEHLMDYSKNVHNIRNLMYIFATTTAIFLITTIYLSKRAHEITAFWAKTLDRSKSGA